MTRDLMMEASRGIGKDPVVSITVALLLALGEVSAERCENRMEARRLRESCDGISK
jgi:hypothetical protein